MKNERPVFAARRLRRSRSSRRPRTIATPIQRLQEPLSTSGAGAGTGAVLSEAIESDASPFPPRAPQEARTPLFARFDGTMAPSDFFTPFISGFGYLLSFAAPIRPSGQSEDLPGPGGGLTCVHGVPDAAKLPRTSPSCGVGDVAFDVLNPTYSWTASHLSFG